MPLDEAADEAPVAESDRPVAVVTGGASGIGRACAQALQATGAIVVVADLRADADHAAARGSGLVQVVCDVRREEDVVALFDRVRVDFGRVDVLVNSAGVIERATRTIEQKVGDWDRVMSVNARGTFLCCREAGRTMVARRSGVIVNISSVAGILAIPGSNAYGPSKAAVALMTRNLACEWARFGVRVNAVAPGYVDAPMAHELFQDETMMRKALERVPQARLGTAQEIAAVVSFLCSPVAGYVTGAVVPVNGGWSALGSAS
ncbi:MAG: SDR family oxidoreductase [Burkholderiaceae bacterium]|nr:SDR family oxidoreductase [Burkholderiaceae bacterium]